MSDKKQLRSQIVKPSPNLRKLLPQEKRDRPLTILIIDDSYEDRYTVKRYLLKNSCDRYAIVETELGEEGLKEYQTCKPDLVLLDYHLPDIDGLEVLAHLQAGETCAPVIMITGQGNELVAVQAMKAGACDYLVKGLLTPESLQNAIANAIEKERSRSQTKLTTSLEQLEDISDITDRKLAEIALRDSQSRMETLTRLSPVGIFRRDRNGNCTYVNERWCAMAGLKPEEAIGIGWVRALHPDDRDRVLAEWQLTFAENELFYSEYRFLRADGTTIWLLGQALPEIDPYGQIVGYIGTVTDITDRKRAERSLQISEERLRLATEAANLGMWFWDLTEDELVWTARCKTLFGLAADTEISYELFLNTLHPDDRDRTRAAVAQAIQDRVDYDIEYRVLWADATVRWIAAKAQVFYNDSDEPIRMMGTVQDISDRKEAELALVRQEQRYRYIFESVGVSVWQEDWLDLKAAIDRLKASGVKDFRSYFASHPEFVQQAIGMVKLVDVNEATVRMFEANNKTQLLDSLHHIFLPESHEMFVEELMTLATKTVFFEGEMMLQTLKGKRLTVLLTLTFPPVDEAYDRVLVTLVDISDRKQAMLQLEEQAQQLSHLNATLLQTTAELAKRNQELDRFAYIASHDLKAPLRAIANLSQWIEEDNDGRLSNESQHYMELLRNRVYRLEGLLDGLLAYSRLGRISVATETTDVGELIGQIIDLLAPPPSITIEILSPMPVLVTKRSLLAQVFFHLIGNAIKHRDRASGRIEIGAISRENACEFFVTDDGPGIAPEYHEKIFTIFQTLKARDEQENTGVGLTIVKKIIELQGGEIVVKSELGKGATFRFTWREE